ncbi:DUF2958 domain-containing protein [Rhizobium sp. ZW T2_16]|uniref:DUF2958 domain-containing protein n=1 Tax=Rhizobium sp. ZW T2_16 TaxID=3378083 RepID=UPI0038533840
MNDSANDEPNLINQTQPHFISSALRRDLTLLCLNELFVGNEPLRLIKKQNPLFLRYETDGIVSTRNYLSPASWRAKILFDVAEGKDFRVLEMDRPGRYKEMFPNTLLHRLLWHSRPKANFPPVARLCDPNGDIEILLTRSRLCGHAVDALHNLSGEPRFQPLWISDIIALRPMLGIELVRDPHFSTSSTLSHFLKAASIAGQVVSKIDLSNLPIEASSPRLHLPQPQAQALRLMELLARQSNIAFDPLSRSIYDDYDLGP